MILTVLKSVLPRIKNLDEYEYQLIFVFSKMPNTNIILGFKKYLNNIRDQGKPCHWKVPNLTSEGPKLYLRSNNGFKKEENALLCMHNDSLKVQNCLDPPKF